MFLTYDLYTFYSRICQQNIPRSTFFSVLVLQVGLVANDMNKALNERGQKADI